MPASPSRSAFVNYVLENRIFISLLYLPGQILNFTQILSMFILNSSSINTFNNYILIAHSRNLHWITTGPLEVKSSSVQFGCEYVNNYIKSCLLMGKKCKLWNFSASWGSIQILKPTCIPECIHTPLSKFGLTRLNSIEFKSLSPFWKEMVTFNNWNGTFQIFLHWFWFQFASQRLILFKYSRILI